MRILLISSSFYPELSPRSFRATELVKEFYRQGHNVTIISKYREHDYSDFLLSYPVDFIMWKGISMPPVPIIRKIPFSILTRGLSRILLLLFEYPVIEEMFKVKSILKEKSDYDLLISFAVPFPVHWGVAWARSKKRPIAKTWVADCGDPYMFARLDRFRKPFYFKFLETSFCRKCDYISIPFKDLQTQFYPQFRSKITVIPQGFDFQEIRLHTDSVEYDKPVFMFAGSIIQGKRDLTLFLDFLSSLSNDFLFIVYTNQREWFEKFKTKLGERLEIKVYIDRLSLIYEMSKVDFVVNVDTIHDSKSNIEAIPSKLIDYALSNRPILNINTLDLDEELVLEFLSRDYSRQRTIDKSNYDIRRISTKFLELSD